MASPPQTRIAPSVAWLTNSSRRINTKLVLAAFVALFLVSVVLPASVLSFAVVTLNVGGLSLEASAPTPVDGGGLGRGAKSNPTKVARAIDTTALTPTATSNQAKPALSTHTVVAGDTLSGIAQMHGMTLATVRILNGLNSDRIRVGDQLTVPGGDQPLRVAVALPTRTPRPPPTAAPQPTVKPVPAQPTATPAPAALATLSKAEGLPVPTPLPRVWQMPSWTSVEDANVSPGQKYYRLVKALYFDEASAGGRVNIFVGVLDENGKLLADIPVKMEWGAGEFTTRKTEDKRDPFLLPYTLDAVATHDMASGSPFSPDRGERGGYRITVAGLPSDAVSGLGLPLRRHVAFLLVYQRTTK